MCVYNSVYDTHIQDDAVYVDEKVIQDTGWMAASGQLTGSAGGV